MPNMMRIQNLSPIAQRLSRKRISTHSLSISSINCELNDIASHGAANKPKRAITSPSSILRMMKIRLAGLESQLYRYEIGSTYNSLLYSNNIEVETKENLDISEETPKRVTSTPINGSFTQSKEDQIANSSYESLNLQFQQLNSVLKAFIEVNMTMKEYRTALNSFYHLKDQIHTSVLDLSSYHSVLSCVARLGNLDELKKVWSLMVKEDQLIPDERCYVYAFQCLGLSKKHHGPEVLELSELINENMVDQGFSFDQLFCAGKPYFQGADQELLYEGVKIISPSFKAKPSFVRPAQYTNGLLKDINLSNTNSLESSLSGIMSRRKLEEAFTKQIRMETDGFVVLPSLSNREFTKDELQLNKQEIDQLCSKWKVTLGVEIKRKLEIMDMKQEENKTICNSFPVQTFLRAIDLDEISEVCVQFLNDILSDSDTDDRTYSPSVSVLQRMLGEEVMKKFHLNLKTKDKQYMEKYESALGRYFDWIHKPSSSNLWCHRHAYTSIVSQMDDGPSLNSVPCDWPFKVVMSVGRELLHIMIAKLYFRMDHKGCIDFDKTSQNSKKSGSLVPILFRVPLRMRKGSHYVEEVKPHPQIAKLFAKQKYNTLTFPVDQLPSLVPPLPWSSPQQGGYFLHPTELVRVSERQVSSKYKQILDNRTKNIHPIFDSLNALGSTPWIVNKKVLDVIINAFLNQNKFGPYLKKMGIPSDPVHVLIPELEDDLKLKLRSKKLSDTDKKLYQNYMKEKQIASQYKADCHSQWNDAQYRLSIANGFRNEVCFFPHNIDFRGRVYPIPPHFNHMGGDYVRSMFLFANGKELGPDGLTWLKLHAINLTGTMKKQSVIERIEYAEKILDLILDSAKDPFGGRRWWLESEDPLQTLATCFEIDNALEYAKQPNKSHEQYICHLPIHQDGSCNGLQHYAALGRDVLGAASVNLIPATTPQDVYNEIATIVERRRSEDDEAGKDIAKVVKGFVRRKVIKQTVMTTVYGVTKYGAKLQIARQLEDIEDFPQNEKEAASKYLANLTFESLNEMFYASQEIQAWFTECANAICGTFNKSVEWTTPLGLPVIQPYMKILVDQIGFSREKQMQTTPLNFKKLLSERSDNEKPSVMKQKNGFPPNFVHSLDSTHMMLTSLYLWNLGITYASVHDCYWTHACSVKPMNEVCREQFVRLHSEPILEQLADSFEDNYLLSSADNDSNEVLSNRVVSDIEMAKAKKLFQSVPKKGNDECALNLNIVKKSVYFFS